MITAKTKRATEELATTGTIVEHEELYSTAEETSVLELLVPLLEERKLIGRWVAAGFLCACMVAFILPVQYTGTTKIMPPQQAQSTASAMLGQLSALAGLAGKDIGLKNPSDMYIGILKSRSIADSLIQQFNLQKYYREHDLPATRKDLERYSDFDSGKDGLITIRFEARDPKLAADIANAYVTQLYQANQRLAISEAGQRRIFFQNELEAEKNALADAEVELKKTQESTGLIQLGSQADAIIRSVAQMRAQLAGKEVELQSMMAYATADNPQVIRTKQEIAAMRTQLSKLEQDNQLGRGNIAIPTGRMPEAGLQYVRKLRDVKYHEQLFEILAKQYEAAKIDEGKNAPVIQVVDTAIVPEKKSGPQRKLIILAVTVLALAFGCLNAWSRSAYRRMQSDPHQRAILDRFHRALHNKPAK
jgi:tyrosine-protein kinase Etk/Wzc